MADAAVEEAQVPMWAPFFLSANVGIMNIRTCSIQ
jgi:hypothetical protein